jgi:predicted PurR-regulated permease PerM
MDQITEDIKTNYNNNKNKSFIENLVDFFNNYLLGYLYIAGIIFLILLILIFFVFSNAPIPILVRKYFAFYANKPYDIKVPIINNQN